MAVGEAWAQTEHTTPEEARRRLGVFVDFYARNGPVVRAVAEASHHDDAVDEVAAPLVGREAEVGQPRAPVAGCLTVREPARLPGDVAPGIGAHAPSGKLPASIPRVTGQILYDGPGGAGRLDARLQQFLDAGPPPVVFTGSRPPASACPSR